jgi:phage terminase small subunit
MTLNPKQKQFCEEYVIDKDVTHAAIRAGYSAKSAHVTGSRLLKNAKVKEYISTLAKKVSDKLEITTERVLDEIASMAFYDVADLVEISDGNEITGLTCPQDIRKLPRNIRRAITGWKYDALGNFIIKLADRSKALDQLARHLSLYNDKIELGGLDALAERLERAHRATA